MKKKYDAKKERKMKMCTILSLLDTSLTRHMQASDSNCHSICSHRERRKKQKRDREKEKKKL